MGDRILLELRVEDDGKMILEATGDEVSGIPVGEPTVIFVTNEENYDENDLFTRRQKWIYSEIPEGANAYSPGRGWDHMSLGHSPYWEDHVKPEEEEVHYYHTLQYVRLDERSVDLARSKILY